MNTIKCARRLLQVLFVSCFCLLGFGVMQAVGAPLVATDFPNLNAAFDALRVNGGTLYIPSGYYTVTKTLNLSGLGYSKGIRIFGDGSGTDIVGDTHGQPIIDMTATGMITLEQLRITSKSANVGILHGRAGGGSSGCSNFSFLFMDGNYSLACVYNVGSEVNRYFNCMFWNNAPGGHGYIFTYRNYFNVTSPYQKLDDIGCNTDLAFYGCFWGVYGGKGTEVNLYLIGPVTSDVSVYGGDMSNKEGGRAAILMDGERGYMLCIRIQGVRFETQGAKHCIEALGTVTDVSIRENMMLSEEETLLVTGVGRKERWNVADNSMESWKEADWGEQTGRPTIRFSNIADSTIDATSGRLDRTKAPGATDSAGTTATATSDKRRFARMSIVVDNVSAGNEFTVRKSEDIRLPAATTGTKVNVLSDGPYRREYFHGAGVGTPVLMNLIPCDTKAIVAPKKGDVLLDSGKNTPNGQPTLAFYDGDHWVYLQTAEKR